MKTVLVLGATGMLGSAVTKKLAGSQKYLVTATSRDSENSYRLLLNMGLPGSVTRTIFDPLNGVEDFQNTMRFPANRKFDYIINCIGIIKPNIMRVGMEHTIRVNSLLPHILGNYCAERGIKLIHITTDCVFSGKKGWYDETHHHDCDDVYGKSKSLGEPWGTAMVLRTSIIGPEVHNNTSLVSWAQSQEGHTVNGFINHNWNGITTSTYGSVVEKIIDGDLWTTGLFHVFSPCSVTKEQLLRKLDQKYNLHLNVVPTESTVPVNRILVSVHDFCANLHLPDLDDQIKEM